MSGVYHSASDIPVKPDKAYRKLLDNSKFRNNVLMFLQSDPDNNGMFIDLIDYYKNEEEMKKILL